MRRALCFLFVVVVVGRECNSRIRTIYANKVGAPGVARQELRQERKDAELLQPSLRGMQLRVPRPLFLSLLLALYRSSFFLQFSVKM